VDFTGTRTLITGSSRGIGRATAVAFASAGAKVMVHYQRDEDAALDTLRSLPGNGHSLVHGDVADPADARRIVDEAAVHLGGLDVLVNNAAIFDQEHALPSVSWERWEQAWRRTIAVNLLGPAWLTWAAVRHMLAGGGRIVNVSSRGAFRGEPTHPAYGASKAGLNAMGQSLARALAPHGIYITTVAPGWVETDMAADSLQGSRGDAIRSELPLGRPARAEEVADVVLFLASQESAQCTGAILDVNGASYLRT
jgi:NAD(P)-dependent dehydrogenase (short-subunit alcohol dehydrogenase family)